MVRWAAIVLGCVVLVLIDAHGAWANATIVGEISSISGTAAIERGGESIPLQPSSKIMRDDVVTTGAASSLGIEFVDGTTMTMGADASMKIDKMVYDPGSDNNSALVSLTQGLFVLVSGQIAKTGDMTVKTPVSTIGIRGTAVAIKAAKEGVENLVTLLRDPDGHVGVVRVANRIASVVLRKLGATARLLNGDSEIQTSQLSPQDISNIYGAALAVMQRLKDSNLGAVPAVEKVTPKQALELLKTFQSLTTEIQKKGSPN